MGGGGEGQRPLAKLDLEQKHKLFIIAKQLTKSRERDPDKQTYKKNYNLKKSKLSIK